MDLTASYITLSGAGFSETPRNSFRARCEAASQAGFSGIGIHIDDLATLDARDVRNILDNTGLRLGEIEFLTGWALDDTPHVAQRTLAQIAELAALCGGDHVSAGEFGSAELDIEQASSNLAIIAATAGQLGLRVAVEAFPWSALSSIEVTSELLRRSAALHAGHLLDVWHFFNTGFTVVDVASIPSASVVAVQLNDGPRVHDNYLWNARNTRWLPGDGELDVVGLVHHLNEIH